ETTQEAVDGMRAVAHGIYPPLLEAEGLEVAFGAARRTIPIPVEITFTGLERYARPVEESLFFCVLGTVMQAVDDGATHIEISVSGEDGAVEFSIRCDAAIGELVSVNDRVDAFGGVLAVTTSADASVVAGHLPNSVTTLEFA
ncbi:MAG: hypothetical protein MUQ27_02550, partial [Acidimicrobiia bacterium]|nr:hypothetical protein [Acidimicrobiia bacterium]